MSTFRESAFFNKSELVRIVYREKPSASNADIRQAVKQRWNVDVAANLIIQAVGRERDRVAYLASHSSLQKLAKQFLADCGGNMSIAINHLRLAG
jgi:hypothetical protein